MSISKTVVLEGTIETPRSSWARRINQAVVH